MLQIWGFSVLTFDLGPNIFFPHTLKHAYTHKHTRTSEHQQETLMEGPNMHVTWVGLMGSDTLSQNHENIHVKPKSYEDVKHKAGAGSTGGCVQVPSPFLHLSLTDVTERMEGGQLLDLQTP